VLWFWVVVLVAIIGAVAVVAAGRGGSMADVYDDRPDASLPTGRPLTAEDLRTLRLNTGVRGYRMDEVDALLERLQAEMLSREADEVRVLQRSEEVPDIAPEPAPDEGRDQA
jgi:DivIVA domain-containing protein